jgi:hypothetical protein
VFGWWEDLDNQENTLFLTAESGVGFGRHIYATTASGAWQT